MNVFLTNLVCHSTGIISVCGCADVSVLFILVNSLLLLFWDVLSRNAFVLCVFYGLWLTEILLMFFRRIEVTQWPLVLQMVISGWLLVVVEEL